MKARTNFINVANDLGASDKALELADELYLPCLGLYVLCLGYCDRQRTDGAITSNAMKRAIAPSFEVEGFIEELVRVGFLARRTNGYRVVGYLDWQRSKAEIEEAAEQRRKAANARWDKEKNKAIHTNDTNDKNDKRAHCGSQSGSQCGSHEVTFEDVD